VKVERIFGADIYRDGGSFGFFFYSDDGRWYEFHLETNLWKNQWTSTTHKPPVIYLEGVNQGNIVRTLSWEEAKIFIAPLCYDNEHFNAIVAIVMSEGDL